MDTLEREGLLQESRLLLREVRGRDGELVRVNLRGRLSLHGGVTFAVNEWLAARRGPQMRLQVRGIACSLHAWLHGNPRLTIARIDDAHGPLHQHRYDASGRNLGSLELAVLPPLDGFARDVVTRSAARPDPD